MEAKKKVPLSWADKNIHRIKEKFLHSCGCEEFWYAGRKEGRGEILLCDDHLATGNLPPCKEKKE